jgi:hypothetical protein
VFAIPNRYEYDSPDSVNRTYCQVEALSGSRYKDMSTAIMEYARQRYYFGSQGVRMHKTVSRVASSSGTLPAMWLEMSY